MSQAVSHYLQQVLREYSTGIASEHAYRPALKELLESVDENLDAVNDPKHIDAGAPDFIILRDRIPIAFTEAKDIGKDLDRVENDEQMRRYRKALPNLILTDYLEFRWYVNGEHCRTVRLGRIERRRIHYDNESVQDLTDLLSDFIRAAIPTVSSARELAVRMADMTREIARLIENSLPSSEQLKVQKQTFIETLIPDLNDQQFADMYAQTLAYGLFAARMGYQGKPDGFTLQNAFWHLPETNPFLQELFQQIAPKLDERVSWLAEMLAKLLAHADADNILAGFGQKTRTEDPIVHFYETFLAEYDPKLRELRGVYYTPEPVVSYIVRSVDYLLKTHFKRPDGLADTNTLILDPATGTGTFLYFVIQQIYEHLVIQRGQKGIWGDYVQRHLLPRTFGFELLMASYAVAHMKLGLELQRTGYQFKSGQRLGIYLTNTLEEEIKAGHETAFTGFITKEANEAAAVKRDKPIMVVLGNPPYSGHSANKGEWIGNLVRDYYQVDGQPLGERNPKWLQDDYVKFIRFGQWRIGQTGSGVLAFVTNHGYLDNPTFRGMRQQLMQAFDNIYILNLHGNSKKKETTPDGGKDENVFDIQQGVAIGIFVKNPHAGSGQVAAVHYADLWGLREEKYAGLLENGLSTTTWQILNPHPFYLFVPQDVDLMGEYEQGWKITDAVPSNTMGVVTGQDKEAIAYTLSEANELAKRHDLPKDVIKPILYRPFDTRFVVYDSAVVTRSRTEVMRHIASADNIALCTNRQVNGDFRHVFCSASIIDSCTVSLETRERTYIFPLYLYPDPAQAEFARSEWPDGLDGRVPNLNPAFVQDMIERLGLEFVTDGQGDLETTFGPEDVFRYTYAVLHSHTYRERYAEFLRTDFPRLPLTGDLALFRVMCGYGGGLVDLHLMRNPALEKLVTTFPAGGSNMVESGYPKYTDANQRVYINKVQYFEGVPREVWEFRIGGYQVCGKWLKDRRGRALSYEDITHYQRVVVALQETIRLMDEIDAAIPVWPIV